MSFIRLLERLVARLKGEPSYRLDKTLSSIEAFAVAASRLMQIVRGLFIRLRVHSAHGLIFAGRHVVIRRASQLSFGRNVILEDYVDIDGMSLEGVHFGNNVTIKKGTSIVCTAVVRHKGVGLTIGNNSSVGCQSYLGAQGRIRIGNDVLIGPGVKIFSEDHHFANASVPIRPQGDFRKEVKIEDNCWIGAGVIIVGGATIGRGSVIAAGSIVTRDIPRDSLAMGIPAKRIRSRLK